MPISRLFIQKSLLSLTVKFHVEEGFLKEVKLMSHPYEGIQWQVEFDEKNSQLEDKLATWIKNYAVGKETDVDLPLPLEDYTDYSKNVLSTLYKIPFGSTISYQSLASLTGKPKAARAVGNVCKKNPCPLIIPCHRVLTTHSELGGFSQGLDVKEKLLNFEKLVLAQ